MQQSKQQSQLLSDGQIAAFQRDGHTHCRGILPASTIAAWDAPIRQVVQDRNQEARPLAERDTYGQAFLQTVNLWEHSEAVRDNVSNPTLAQAAAELMGCNGVRLYHDHALFKEAGGGHTPWYCDQFYWPLADPRTVTAWIPLVPVSMDMGPLAFAPGSQELTACRGMKISDESHQAVAQMLHQHNIKTTIQAYALGDVSFHYGWTYHCAGSNRSNQERAVMTIIYMADDMKIHEPKNKQQQMDWDQYCPGINVGDIAASPLNPILWQR